MNDSNFRQNVGQRIRWARQQKYRTVDEARIAAGIARGTWDKAEKGEPVKDFSMAAIERAIGWPAGLAAHMLSGGDPANWPDRPASVGPTSEDDESYVKAPGELVEGGASDRAVLDAIEQMQRDMQEMDRRLSERMDRIEGSGA